MPSSILFLPRFSHCSLIISLALLQSCTKFPNFYKNWFWRIFPGFPLLLWRTGILNALTLHSRTAFPCSVTLTVLERKNMIHKFFKGILVVHWSKHKIDDSMVWMIKILLKCLLWENKIFLIISCYVSVIMDPGNCHAVEILIIFAVVEKLQCVHELDYI